MEYYVYILHSSTTDRYYRGITSDLADRIERHNRGSEKSTKTGAPWKLVWVAKKPSRSEAYKLEKKLKNLSRQRLKDFMKKYAGGSRP